MADLDRVVQTESAALDRHEQTKQKIETDIHNAEAAVEGLKGDLANANADLNERTTEVDEAKKAFNTAAKVVDKALKRIATKACEIPVGDFHKNAHRSVLRMVKSRSSVWSVLPSIGVAGWTKSGFLC